MRPSNLPFVGGFVALILSSAQPAAATTYQVSPVLLEAQGGAAAEVLTIRNTSDHPIALQIRLFRWTQADGHDVLTPTTEVIASPPAANVPAGRQHLVRVVRTTPAPAKSEEAYRLLIDEIPDPTRMRSGQVTLLLRQSIPVFFGSRASRSNALQWQLVRVGTGWELAATNAGDRRQRVSDLQITGANGAVLQTRAGLVGYALSGSTARWPVKLPSGYSGPVVVRAVSDTGKIHADLAASRTP